MPSPVPLEIVLSDDERTQLESWARRRTSAAGLAMRSRIVLAAAEGGTNVAVAARLGLSRSTVRLWRSRFAEHRLDGLVDEPRPGRPRTVTDAQVDALITETLESAPTGDDARIDIWRTPMAANGPVSDFAVHPVRLALMVTSAVWIGGFILAAPFARGLMAARVRRSSAR